MKKILITTVILGLVLCGTSFSEQSIKDNEIDNLKKGQEYREKGMYKEAIDEFTQRIKVDPKSALLYSNRGLTYFDMGELDKALLDYNKAIELYPRAEDTRNNRGFLIVLKVILMRQLLTTAG